MGHPAGLEPATSSSQITVNHRPFRASARRRLKLALYQLSYGCHLSTEQVSAGRVRAKITIQLRLSLGNLAGLEPATSRLQVDNERSSAHRWASGESPRLALYQLSYRFQSCCEQVTSDGCPE